MNRQIRPHPSPLPKGEGTRLLAPFSLGRRAIHICIQQRRFCFNDSLESVEQAQLGSCTSVSSL
ncbi:MAG: hypothetical protein LH660_16875 [Phormidesmis sp. CAN_BIN36]|nr:hypothetical protein [Phormidesmis sp. CAN_BIN36]